MAPKKAKAGMTAEQQEAYNQVFKNLQSSGVLNNIEPPAAAEDGDKAAPAAKRRKGKQPEEASTTATDAESSPETAKAKAKAKTTPAPKKVVAKPKPKTKAAAPTTEPAQETEPGPKRAKATSAAEIPAKEAKPKQIWCDELNMMISWDKLNEIVPKVLALYPGENPYTINAVMESELGPRPSHLPPLEDDTAHKPEAAEERHPGPVLEDATLEDEEEEEEVCEDQEEEGDDEEGEEESDEDEKETLLMGAAENQNPSKASKGKGGKGKGKDEGKCGKGKEKEEGKCWKGQKGSGKATGITWAAWFKYGCVVLCEHCCVHITLKVHCCPLFQLHSLTEATPIKRTLSDNFAEAASPASTPAKFERKDSLQPP